MKTLIVKIDVHEAQKYRGLHIDIFPYEGNMIPWLQHLAAKLSVNVNLKMQDDILELHKYVITYYTILFFQCFVALERYLVIQICICTLMGHGFTNKILSA